MATRKKATLQGITAVYQNGARVGCKADDTLTLNGTAYPGIDYVSSFTGVRLTVRIDGQLHTITKDPKA